MTETNVLPWIEVNEMMDEEYRQQVVADALGYYPKASPELNKFALAVFKNTIHVNGFRSFQSIRSLRISSPSRCRSCSDRWCRICHQTAAAPAPMATMDPKACTHAARFPSLRQTAHEPARSPSQASSAR